MAWPAVETIPRIDRIPSTRDGGLVLAVTDDGTDQRYAAVRDAAGRIARTSRSRVLLFHAPEDPFTRGGRPRLFVPPGLTGSSEVPRPHTGSRRHDLLREEASQLRSHGLEVAVWLAPACGPAAIAEAVVRTDADLVLLPVRPERRCLRRPTVDRTLAYFASRIAVPLVSVDPAGRLTLIAPLGARAGRAVHEAFDRFDLPADNARPMAPRPSLAISR